MVLQYLKKADYLSKSPALNFKGDLRIQSIFGGVLTIIFGCFAVLATIYIGRDLVARQSPSLVFETRQNEENKVMLVDYPIGIAFKNFYGRDLGQSEDFLNSIEIYVEINHLLEEGVRAGMFPIKKCDASFVSVEFIEEINKTAATEITFCPDFNQAKYYSGQEFDKGSYIQKSFGEANSSFLSVTITSCNKKQPNCTEFEHVFGVFYASVLSFDSFTETSNYPDPVKKRVNRTTGQVTQSFYTRQYIEIDYNFLKTDDGWLFTRETSEMHYSLGNKTYEIADFSETARLLYQFTFTAPSQERITKRRYVKIPEIIAFVGGFAKAVLLGLKVILSFYSDYWLKVATVREFSTNTPTSLNQSHQAIKFGTRERNNPNLQKKEVKVSHFKEFFRSLFCSSTNLNLDYKRKLAYLDVLTIMKAVEKVKTIQASAQIEER